MKLPRSNVFWSGFEAATAAALSFASVFIVARIVGPAELGIGAAAVSLHVLFWIVVNAIFADALVQRPSVSEEQAISAVWAAGAVGICGAVLQALLGWAVAASLGDPRLVAMSLLLAATLPIVGVGGAMQGLLTRNRQYRALAGRTLIGQGLGTATGIVAALAGAGAWALVLQQGVTSLVGALTLVLRAPVRPRALFHWPLVRDLLPIGVPLVASTLVQHCRYRLFALIIGATAGPAVLGEVHMAFRLVDTVRDLAITALWRLALPTMSERQHDLRALRASLDRLLSLSGVVLFPAIGGMVVLLRPVVTLLLGPVWIPAAQAATLLAVLAAWNFLSFPGGVAVVARGRPHLALMISLAATVLTVAGAAVLRPASPLDAVWVWIGAQLLILPPSCMVMAHVLRTDLLAPLRAGFPALGLAAFATAVALLVPWLWDIPDRSLAGALVPVLIGAAIYLPGAWLLLSGSVRGALQAVGLATRTA
jgi:PST family polysaccharide transporter